MRKVGIVFDSSCGFDRDYIESIGAYYVPLIMEANDKVYRAGIDISGDEFNNLLLNAKSIKTSANLPIDVFTTWDKALKECEQIVHITLSHKLSKTNELCMDLSQGGTYKDRVFVIENSNLAAPWLGGIMVELVNLVNNSKNIKQVIKNLTAINKTPFGMFTMPTLKWLAKGGRVNPVKAFIGNLLKLCPLITYVDGHMPEKLIDKVRGYDNAMKRVLSKINDVYEADYDKKDSHIYITFEGLKDQKEKVYEIVESTLNIKKDDVKFVSVGDTIKIHTGPALFGVWIVFDNLKKYNW